MSLTQGLNLEADLSFILQTTQDRQRGINSFLNKPPPNSPANDRHPQFLPSLFPHRREPIFRTASIC